MTCLDNFILRFIQYHYILHGLTYIYIDIGGRVIKISKFFKFYSYISNILRISLMIYNIPIIFGVLDQIYIDNIVRVYTAAVFYICRISVLVIMTLLCCKDDIFLRKCLKIFLPFQTIYPNKFSLLSTDKFLKRIQISYILIVFLQFLHDLIVMIKRILSNQWLYAIQNYFLEGFFYVMFNYVMMRHIFILCYIKNWFSILNDELKTEHISESFSDIYMKLSLTMEEWNRLNGPLIFGVLFCQLLQIPDLIYMLYQTVLSLEFLVDITVILKPAIILVLFINMFLYFLMCDRVYRMDGETTEILMGYDNTKQKNQLVST